MSEVLPDLGDLAGKTVKAIETTTDPTGQIGRSVIIQFTDGTGVAFFPSQRLWWGLTPEHKIGG